MIWFWEMYGCFILPVLLDATLTGGASGAVCGLSFVIISCAAGTMSGFFRAQRLRHAILRPSLEDERGHGHAGR